MKHINRKITKGLKGSTLFLHYMIVLFMGILIEQLYFYYITGY